MEKKLEKKFIDNLTTGQSELLSRIRREKFEDYQEVEIPEFKRIKLTDNKIPEYQPYNKNYLKHNTIDSSIIVKKLTDSLNNEEEIIEYLNFFSDSELNSGIDKKYTLLAESLYNAGLFIKAPAGEKFSIPVEAIYEFDEKNSFLIDNNLIVAEENSNLTVVFDYRLIDKNTEAFHNGLTRIVVKEGAVLNIIKVQRLNDKSTNFDTNISAVENNGKLNFIPIEIGAKSTITSSENNLLADGSSASISSIYFGDGDRKMDLSYRMNHSGRHSSSQIETKGVLKDRSEKVFRGDLYFKKGASLADGSEREEILMLDPTVKSDSIPALFTEEDNVEGEHAVSAGQLDENLLFYLMSRGLDEKKAKMLVIEAAFNPIFDKIPLNDLKGSVINEVKHRLEI
ncbi:iron-regulated ABC transporter permease protein SufD [Halanaerobium sp. DL-01]|uniref:Fe-S cluster assembly protein SufD n=1 Tax=Halanaerobium sp. DL-01 TaxID=1653064 RepID=UPI000DF2344A|nr:Fe-S cluster assembly protein SufD [Halanaerobium sp. DL-01]RCW86596.1 iron-regulated ABC transporter permease protein SufD [Halanaerobium sp. DL-01]